MKRVAVAAVLLAGACTPGEPITHKPTLTVDITITGATAPDEAQMVSTVDGATATETVPLPVLRTIRAWQVVIQVTATAGVVGCVIGADGGTWSDQDPRPSVAACSASLLERGR